jgi:hypothetical protein
MVELNTLLSIHPKDKIIETSPCNGSSCCTDRNDHVMFSGGGNSMENTELQSGMG